MKTKWSGPKSRVFTHSQWCQKVVRPMRLAFKCIEQKSSQDNLTCIQLYWTKKEFGPYDSCSKAFDSRNQSGPWDTFICGEYFKKAVKLYTEGLNDFENERFELPHAPEWAWKQMCTINEWVSFLWLAVCKI